VKVEIMTKQLTLKIVGMHCGGCSSSVEKALKGVVGVSYASIDLGAGKAVVDYDPDKADARKMADAVKKAGFAVG
jgi:copper chaperone CopZ